MLACSCVCCIVVWVCVVCYDMSCVDVLRCVSFNVIVCVLFVVDKLWFGLCCDMVCLVRFIVCCLVAVLLM